MQTINRPLMVSMVLLLAVTVTSSVLVTPVQSATHNKIPGKLSGNIGIVSKYVFRGWVESDQPAVQGGFDYTHPSGFYAGYWGSTLGHTSYPSSNAGVATPTENDFYAGYAGSAGPIRYDIGLTQFTYSNQPASACTGPNGNPVGCEMTEAGLSLGFGPISVATNYALNNGFHNKGDWYTAFSYGTTIPFGFDFNAKAGFYTADQRDVQEGLEDIVVGVSHPIEDSGATMSLQYVYADSDINNTGNQVVMGVSYGFSVAR